MAERLTTRFHGILVKEADVSKIQVITKLGQLEDIMEKYDIESFELLEHIIKKGKVINSVIEDFAKEEYDKMKQDRATWKRACELACGTIISEEIDGEDLYDVIEKWKVERDIEMYGFDDRLLTDYFYQQAKKGNKKVQIHYCTNDETNKILGDIKIKDDFSTTMQNLAKMYADTLKDLDTAEDKDN